MGVFFAHPCAVSSNSSGVLDSLETTVGQIDVVRSGGVVTLASLGVAEVLTAGRVVHFIGELVVSGLLRTKIGQKFIRCGNQDRVFLQLRSHTKFAQKWIIANCHNGILNLIKVYNLGEEVIYNIIT